MRWTVGLGAAALLLVACGGSTAPAINGTPTPTGSQPTATAPTATAAPTTSAASSNLTGLGATVAQMKAKHGADSGPGVLCTAANSCFGAGVTNDESGKTYQFVDVSVQAGLIVGYQQNFPTNTSVSVAESQILQWLPKDSIMGAVTIDHTGGSCALYNITSPTLAQLFAASQFDDPRESLASN
jgi:hypothetical protein